MPAFQSIQTGKLPDKLLETAPVGKTIMIGLGGTGKEVILRLRRLIVERFGELDALPCIQFLHLDTDTTTNAQYQYDKGAQDDPLYDKVRFQPFERINLTIDGGSSKYLANINAYPNIKEWFHTKGKIADLGDLGEGAGQIRMASRLGFYDKYNDIEAGLGQAERRLGRERNRGVISRLGFSFDSSIMNIYVVASLAGGTGSGTFLDMGFLVKTMFPDSTRIGVFFMPSFFAAYPGSGRMKANGYAALKELNHYSFGNSFTGNWTGREQSQIYPPPFDYTYLLEGKNEINEAIGSSSEEFSMYQMVAETVFQEFSLGEFAGTKRAIRVNLKNFIDNAYVHNYWDAGETGTQGSVKGESYTTRFCSFGLGSIYFPTEKIHRACACCLARDILDTWQQHVVDEPLEILFSSFLVHPDIEFVQGEYTRRDGGGVINKTDAEDMLLMYNKDAGQTFQSYMWNKALEIRSEVEAQPNGQKQFALESRRNQWDQLMAKADSDNPDEWGMDVRTIHGNMDKYVAKVEKGIEEQANKLANNPGYGISYTLSLLRELKKLLKNDNFRYLPYFEDSITYWNEQIQDYKYHLDQLQTEIGNHERQFLFRKADLERDMDILVPTDARGQGMLYNYYLARVMKQVAKRGKRICEIIDKYLGEDSSSGKGLLGKYHQLTSGLDKLKERLERKEKYYSAKEDYATMKNLYQDGDVKEWYNTWMGEPEEQKQNLKQVSDELLTKIFGVSTVTEALNYIQQNPIENIEDQVIEECRIFFAAKPTQPSALEMLMDDRRCSKRERENLVETVYARAKVWLKPTQKVDQVQFRITNQQKPCIIGVDENDRVRFGEFQNIVTSRMGPADTEPQFKNVGEAKKGAIVFYNEIGGATAFYPSSVTEVGGLRQNYDEFCRSPKDISPKNQEDVHIDKNRFQFEDIIPKTENEVRKYKDSIRAFVLARLLGVLKAEEIFGDDRITVINRYSYEQQVPYDIIEEDLGDEFAAIDILYQDTRPEHESHRKLLYDQAEDIVDELCGRRLLSIYLLLIEFYLTHVYPAIIEDSGIAGVQIRRYSPFYAALDSERRRVNKELLPAEEERERVHTALTKLRGKSPGKRLDHEEYINALKPYTKMSGKFEVITKSTIGTKRVFLDVPVLDRKKAFSEARDTEDEVQAEHMEVKPIVTPPQPSKQKPRRPCPVCNKTIDARATFCTNCKKTVAAHITCQHCGEEKVPEDLAICWNCGREPRKEEKTIECLRCFSFEGPISKFPCPVCEWNPPQSGEARDLTESGTEEAYVGEQPEPEYSNDKPEGLITKADQYKADQYKDGLDRFDHSVDKLPGHGSSSLRGEPIRDDDAVKVRVVESDRNGDQGHDVEPGEQASQELASKPESEPHQEGYGASNQQNITVKNEAESTRDQIECPHCYTPIESGQKVCNVCGGDL